MIFEIIKWNKNKNRSKNDSNYRCARTVCFRCYMPANDLQPNRYGDFSPAVLSVLSLFGFALVLERWLRTVKMESVARLLVALISNGNSCTSACHTIHDMPVQNCECTCHRAPHAQ